MNNNFGFCLTRLFPVLFQTLKKKKVVVDSGQDEVVSFCCVAVGSRWQRAEQKNKCVGKPTSHSLLMNHRGDGEARFWRFCPLLAAFFERNSHSELVWLSCQDAGVKSVYAARM